MLYCLNKSFLKREKPQNRSWNSNISLVRLQGFKVNQLLCQSRWDSQSSWRASHVGVTWRSRNSRTDLDDYGANVADGLTIDVTIDSQLCDNCMIVKNLIVHDCTWLIVLTSWGYYAICDAFRRATNWKSQNLWQLDEMCQHPGCESRTSPVSESHLKSGASKCIVCGNSWCKHAHCESLLYFVLFCQSSFTEFRNTIQNSPKKHACRAWLPRKKSATLCCLWGRIFLHGQTEPVSLRFILACPFGLSLWNLVQSFSVTNSI